MSLLLLLVAGEPFVGDTISLPSAGDLADVGHGVDVVEVNEDLISLPSAGDVARAGTGTDVWVADGEGGYQPVGFDELNPVRFHLYPDGDLTAAPIELEDSFARRWLTMRSDTGSVECGLANDDPALSSIGYTSLLRVDIDGTPRVLGLVEDDDKVVIDRSDEIGQITHLRGSGIVAEWERAVVLPSTPLDGPLFDDQVRRWTWAAPELDVSTFALALEQWRQDTDDPDFSAKHGMPLGWPDKQAWWIWSTTSDQSPPLHDPGRSPFWADLAVAARTQFGMYVGCDDGWLGYIDGVPLGGDPKVNSWKEVVRLDFTLDPGTHRIALLGENFDRLASTNTAGLICSVYTLDESGNDDQLVLRTNGTDWRTVHYPENLPGFTAGQVVRLFLEGNQALGQLPGWTLDFDDETDANGNPWPTGQQFTFPVGLDGLSFLRQLADTHLDFRIAGAARRLIATRLGELGSPTTVGSLVDQMQSLSFEGRG